MNKGKYEDFFPINISKNLAMLNLLTANWSFNNLARVLYMCQNKYDVTAGTKTYTIWFENFLSAYFFSLDLIVVINAFENTYIIIIITNKV